MKVSQLIRLLEDHKTNPETGEENSIYIYTEKNGELTNLVLPEWEEIKIRQFENDFCLTIPERDK